MSEKRSLFDRNFATGDHTSNPQLQTHYYRNDYNKAKSVVLEIAEQLKYRIENVDDRFREIYLSSSNHNVTINIINLSYFEVAIDISVSGSFFFGRKKAIELITKIYQLCDRRLNFKGKGLYNENNATFGK